MSLLRRAVPARLRRYKPTNAWLRARRFEAQMALRPQPLVIYSMQSSGSSTLTYAVRQATTEKVLQVHYLTREGMAWRRGIAGRVKNRRGGPEEYHISPWVARQMDRSLGGEPWTFITATRNPVDRSVSHFFQGFRGPRLDHFLDGRDQSDDEILDRAIARFEGFQLHPTSIRWFDWEFGRTTGIDVYEEPFPIEIGFRIFERQGTRALVIRSEDLSRAAQPALSEFLQIDGLPVQSRNVAGPKPYATLYRRFVNEAVVSDQLLESLLESRYARHFYTDDERADTYRRWSKR